MSGQKVKQFHDRFNEIKVNIEDDLMADYSLGVKVGYREGKEGGPDARFGEIALFKILKEKWTRTPPEELGNDGVFFAMWVTPKEVEMKRVKYNVHALKLRTFPQYKLKAWDFADAFRARARREIQSLPNVNMDLGPGNLFEGYVNAELGNLKNACTPIIETFVNIHPIIDDLLEKAERNT